MKKWMIVCLMLFAGLLYAQHPELPRRGVLNAALLEVPDSLEKKMYLDNGKGVLIDYVIEGGAAHRMGLMAGDIVLKFNGQPPGGVQSLISHIGSMQQGDYAELEILRKGRPMTLDGRLSGFPEETSDIAEVIYDAVAFSDGWLRTIIHKPKKDGPMPAIFFIQGLPCSSIDNLNPTHPFARMIRAYTELGYVVIKTEKPGVGDSRGFVQCPDIDLATEAAAFSASFNALSGYDFIDKSQIFVFGFSMGGVVAPLLQTDFPPRGFMVFGTVVRPWFDYFTELVRIQRLLRGQDYLLNEANHETAIRFFYRFMIEKETPEELWQDNKMKEFLTSWGYRNDNRLNGRSCKFWHQLQDTPMFSVWAEIPAPVLSLWGEGDFVAFNPYEHQLIADIVNRYKPGFAEFIIVPNTDHNLNFVRDQKHSVQIINDYNYQRDHFNPAIINITDGWMQKIHQPKE